ncbi:type II toxin-antitoxin system Phd/YefM family antitoxin [Oxalobacteraceae bacterium A2-2]
MHTFTVAQAKVELSRLIALVEAGEQVTITRRGQAVVRLVKSVSQQQQLPSLAQLRAGIPRQVEQAGEFMRKLRDSDRY